MTLLLSCDEYCYIYNGDYYVNDTGLTHINRYLSAFDNIVVAFRTKAVNLADDLGKYHNRITSNRIRFISIPFFQGPKQLLTKYFSINKAVKKGIYDCDFAIFRLPSPLAFIALNIIRDKKIPYATEIVFDCFDAYTSSTSLINKFIWRKMHKMQVKACNNALGVSCVTARYLQNRYYPESPNAITSHYSSIELKPDFFTCNRKFPNKQVITLIHVSNQVSFRSRKGHNELIEVLALLNKHRKQAEVVFVGEDYNNGIEQLTNYASELGVDKDIHFTGFLTKTKLREELEAADIAVLPTKAEGLPRVVIEAMALGLPCITSPVSGNPELINKEFLVDYNNVAGMADACKTLINNPEIYEQESLDNFNKSKEYSCEILNPKRTDFYKQLIELSHKIH